MKLVLEISNELANQLDTLVLEKKIAVRNGVLPAQKINRQEVVRMSIESYIEKSEKEKEKCSN